MGAVTPGETLGTLYTSGVGSNKTKQHRDDDAMCHGTVGMWSIASMSSALGSDCGAYSSRLARARICESGDGSPGWGKTGERSADTVDTDMHTRIHSDMLTVAHILH